MLDPARDQRSCKPNSGDSTSQFSLLWLGEQSLSFGSVGKTFVVFTSSMQSFNGVASKSGPDGFVQAVGPLYMLDKKDLKEAKEESKSEKCFMQKSRNAKAEMELKVLTSCSLSASPRAGEGEC